MEKQLFEAPKPANPILEEVQGFMERVPADRVIIAMVSEGRGQYIRIMDFGDDLKKRKFRPSLPPDTRNQAEWDDIKTYLEGIEVPDKKAQVLHEDSQLGNADYGNKNITESIAELHEGLQYVRELRQELENETDPEQRDTIAGSITATEQTKQQILTSLQEAGYTLPFEV